MKTIESILNSVSDKIYERGEDYYRFGNIIEITNNNGEYIAAVEGSNGESYDVNVEIDSNGNVKFFDCDCPYDYSPICKHIVAVLLSIQNGEGKNSISIDDRLNMLSKAELVNLLADWARDDYKIREKLDKKLNALLNNDYDALGVIYSIIDDYSDYDGYINYYSCYDMCMEITDTINNEYQCFEKDNSLKHIQKFLLINRKLIDLMECCDDSDGGLTIALSEVNESLYNFCVTIFNSKNIEDCIACLNMLCTEVDNKSYNYFFDAKFEILNIAVLFSEYNAESVLKVIDSLITQCKKDHEYYFGNAILLKYQFVSKTKNKEVADEFILNYANLDDVCEYLIKQYIDKEEYEAAEKLCLKKLKNAELPNKWNTLLSNIYGKSEQFNKQLDIELKCLLNGNAARYDTVKKLMQELDVWEKSYTDLLYKLSYKLPPFSYAEILKNEGEYEKLLDLVTKHKNLIEQYFKPLAKYYPEEAYNMYYDFIAHNAEQAGSRRQYQSVCKRIVVLYNAGDKQGAKQIIALLKSQYQRRSAFLDELSKTSKKLKI